MGEEEVEVEVGQEAALVVHDQRPAWGLQLISSLIAQRPLASILTILHASLTAPPSTPQPCSGSCHLPWSTLEAWLRGRRGRRPPTTVLPSWTPIEWKCGKAGNGSDLQ